MKKLALGASVILILGAIAVWLMKAEVGLCLPSSCRFLENLHGDLARVVIFEKSDSSALAQYEGEIWQDCKARWELNLGFSRVSGLIAPSLSEAECNNFKQLLLDLPTSADAWPEAGSVVIGRADGEGGTRIFSFGLGNPLHQKILDNLPGLQKIAHPKK